MADFSSFFPAAGGGGGGFTKMNKYSTFRAKNDATHKLAPGQLIGAQWEYITVPIGATSFTNFQVNSYQSTLNQIVGGEFVLNNTLHTITSNTAYDPSQGGFNFTFTPALTATVAQGASITINNTASITVNPATDLGLSDGDSLGFFMVSSGSQTNNGQFGGEGGKIISGSRIITTASTNLVLTPGVASTGYDTLVHSTISGGLTLTTADGSNGSGWGSKFNGAYSVNAAGSGVNGYGVGGENANSTGTGRQGSSSSVHGFGSGSRQNNTPGDGAILLYY